MKNKWKLYIYFETFYAIKEYKVMWSRKSLLWTTSAVPWIEESLTNTRYIGDIENLEDFAKEYPEYVL